MSLSSQLPLVLLSPPLDSFVIRRARLTKPPSFQLISLIVVCIYVMPTTRELLCPHLKLAPVSALTHLAHPALCPWRSGGESGCVIRVAYNIVPQRVKAVHDMHHGVCWRPSGVQIRQAFLDRLL